MAQTRPYRRRRRAAVVAPAALATLLGACGCPSADFAIPVVAAAPAPAAVAAPQASPDPPEDRARQRKAADGAGAGRSTAAPDGAAKAAQARDRRSTTPAPAKPTRSSDAAGDTPAGAAESGGPAEARPTRADAAGVPFAPPAKAEHVYDLTGRSSRTQLPDTMRLTIEPDATDPAAQRWTFDARTPQGYGTVERFVITPRKDAFLLSSYGIENATELGNLALAFAPKDPVLLVPANLETGREWSFDLTSTNGCALVRTAARAVEATARTVRLRYTSTVTGTGKLGCAPIEVTRVQELRFGPAGSVPERVTTDLDGSLAGIRVDTSTTATRRDATP